MKETVMVKHAVTGREFLNNNKLPLEYEFAVLPEGGYRMTFRNAPPDIAADIVHFRGELNMFRFEIPAEGPQIKHWYYVSPETVQFDSAQGILVIEAASEIRYVPDEYWA
ncbi:hypothetical protein ACE3MZ_21145 [Paenibacillus sp. WLX1005]|uniref:hypothetical protein n=1 Tax=Paenibacillus sp. WLX1005 TaxID=3243766 RepID=UPI00398418E0